MLKIFCFIVLDTYFELKTNFLVKILAWIKDDLVIKETACTFYLDMIDSDLIVNGVEVAIKAMKRCQKMRVLCTPEHAYGEKGNEKYAIPPNSSILYEIHLLSFEKVTIFLLLFLALLGITRLYVLSLKIFFIKDTT